MTQTTTATKDKTITTQKPKTELSFSITISYETTKQKTITQQRNYKTKISASTLEEAFKQALKKAKTMKEDDPEHNNYTVTDVRIA
jgi:hypothetical protein